MSMYVNKYELYPYDEFVFSQRCTGYNGTEYHLMKDQIESSHVSYSEEYDSFLVKSILKDGMDWFLIPTKQVIHLYMYSENNRVDGNRNVITIGFMD